MATGLLGHAMFRSLSRVPDIRVEATIRQQEVRALFGADDISRLRFVADIEDFDELLRLFEASRPDIVINCVAVGRPTPTDPMRSIFVYSVFPRRLSHICKLFAARLVQISSDGVFSGRRGAYSEADFPDAQDVYGVSKFLGEIDEPHALTLRTSLIGHELRPGGTALLEWFLAQETQCRCYTKAMFSGFPAHVLADVVRDFVLPRPALRGVYHLATKPISKFDLLSLVAGRYGKNIELIPDDRVSVDRTLVAARFEKATGYIPPDWPTLIDLMYCDRLSWTRT